MVVATGDDASKKYSFETALDLTGFGKYNIIMLSTCCFTILAMYMDIFGFSILMPPIACDISLDNAQQGLLSAVPLMGVMFSSYVWGLAADTIGRRKTLLIAMPIGFLFNIAASMAPGYTSLAILKFFSATFTSSANAAAFVLLGESVSSKNRSRFMFIMASATLSTQLLLCLFAIPVYKLTFHYEISWLNVDYRPWRLLMQIISLPAVIGILNLLILKESPKFLLSKGKNYEALAVLQNIFKWNTGLEKNEYPVTHVYLDDEIVVIEGGTSLLLKIWNQTAPLFKPPLLKNSIILYYILLCAYMTCTGFSMWVPTMTNEFFMGEDTSGRSFCEVSSRSAVNHQTASRDCDHIIQPLTFYAVMFYSAMATCLGIVISFIVGPLGKKFTTLMVFVIAIVCGILLLFSKIPLLSMGLFFFFLYVSLILGNINTYLVELNPTHLRGMATCLSVVVARGFAFISVQLIGNLLANHCTAMMSGFIALNISGLLVAAFLPPDHKKNRSQH
ncbi:unnamed protein product [Arctia plantaginis]|uniref:Major facilitator superfamily (MFS) profile domain-containing protein n=1 Tax=Arctia plantaginis TaxID=874455 RepID=A0A8S0Z3J2_ARCPL|nr:unnamed protein product [Arctia plantaginis]